MSGSATSSFYSKSNDLWEMFKSQAEAFNYFDRLSTRERSGLKLLTCELPQSGGRRFIVAHTDQFRKNMDHRTINTEHRHVYEIIRDGFPCRLYFDLEFTKEDGRNFDVNGDELTKQWIILVAGKIYEKFGIKE